MTTNRTKWFFQALGLSASLLLAGGVQAATITYEIAIDTSTLLGDSGYLDFQFNPGNTPYDTASATLMGFSSDATLTTPAPNLGDVLGSLPGTVVIGNTDLPNEYTPGITFASFFDVFVTLDIPVVSGNATGGSSFTLDVEDSNFNSVLGNFPAVEIDLDATTGVPAVSNHSGDAASVSQTPEPGTLALLGTGLALIGWICLGRRNHVTPSR